ncbi:hypothetical protein RLOatenuis_3200 [Rickettsiales bacterium]|nr:hypothetical protein RLOatenuis_3200 [Rickettsiales bacterium]
MDYTHFHVQYPGLYNTLVHNPEHRHPIHLAGQFIQELSAVYKAVAKDLPEDVKLNFVSVICLFINYKSPSGQQNALNESLEKHFKAELKEFTQEYLLPYIVDHPNEEDMKTIIKNAAHLSPESDGNHGLRLQDIRLLSSLISSLEQEASRHPDFEQQIFHPGAVAQSSSEPLPRSHDPAKPDKGTPSLGA